ncbi:FAD-dependent oxidoreductase [Crassaminicella thermophila]|uniref:FAD-dependent oxidoreductase n=1 Tax=Crassaminicella thermophila TaxID=2599308 RepID=A0A5C0SDT3_CRATE|nr:NAD(P)/FAD-dependent oxidoreductase [Crassaminicella thermophila]QEK12441.1 FAD-dependent oxidoreductase [Crassaminicella thermophila]
MNKLIVVIGAGPAGLCASIEAAKLGAKVLLLDENLKPGGQLFKQIHKFFGSKEHLAGVRGFDIGRKLLEEAKKLNIEVSLKTEVLGIDKDKNIWAIQNGKKSIHIKADRIILATGAMEKPISFPGWTLPGVMGAGAVQTMMNLHRVLPGKRVVMLGSGNVGVITAYQLLQAGADVIAILEAGPYLGAYGVHTAKLSRLGVPFYTSCTIKEAVGKKYIEVIKTVKLDKNWKYIKGTEKILSVDTVCIATGLTPITELAWIVGCEFVYVKNLGGHIPIHNEYMETTVKGIYVAGDIAGVEEASTAMDEGRLAGIHAAASLGFLRKGEKIKRIKEVWDRLDALRLGSFGKKRKEAKEYIINIGRRLIR